MKAVEALALVVGHVDEELLLRNEYLAAENEILRAKLPGRVPLNNDERIRLAKLGKRVGTKALKDMAAIVTPETILAWYRRLVAKKYDGSKNRGPGRPRIDPEVEKLIVGMATANPSWGYDRIAGALSNLGHGVCDETVGRVLRRHGIPPAGGRKPKMSWADFIATHQDAIVAADFFTVEVFTPMGLVCCYVLFFIHIDSRRVHIAGITEHPTESWMKQVAKNVTMEDWGFLNGRRYLILDRDSKFCAAFRHIIESARVKILRLPPRSPNLNAFAERFVRSVKEEALSKLVLFGEDGLRRALYEFMSHYHEERNHQGVGNVLLFPSGEPAPAGPVDCKERLGGLLKFYHRAAA